ncbi:unnamed protein product [Cuscuta campestris]|uniref:Uncharacterized protein n=1 Tax=Cuscuta campestris TaxID=132261 RepID=A0A484M5H1_9ASTE|nr:unnamed protein product [Cuscuta campestris]
MEGTSRTLPYTIRFVGLLGSHSLGRNPKFMATAVDLGRELIRRRISLAYGGGNVGLQGAVASTVFTSGGLVRSFIPGYITTRRVYGPTYGVEHIVSERRLYSLSHLHLGRLLRWIARLLLSQERLRDDFMQFCREYWEEIPFHGEGEDAAARAELLYEADPSPENRALCNLKQAELDVISKRKYAFWRQKCNVKWLQDGDANTKFFHNLVKEKRRKQRISTLTNDQGQTIEDTASLEAMVVEHYKNLFNSHEPMPSHEVSPKLINLTLITYESYDLILLIDHRIE